MNKARKMVVMLLMVFCAVSVSMGAWIPEEYEANYQKLKAEVEEYGGEDCKWSEDGKKLISGDLCQYKKVLMFFDEIRAMEVTKKQASRWGICFGEKKWKTCGNYDKFAIARREVREMPLFKNASGIYAYTRSNNLDQFWEHWIGEYGEWKKTKRKLRMDGARRDYWKKMAE